ncbi:MAG TPA: hypothetical protein VFR97_02280 [Capillimicrobium sp.]|nr:hypothetical protein [Capillimicrobium sp.]
MDAPTVGLALIARDEEATLPTLLQSIEGAFDRVVLLDTGSTDGTVDLFHHWAAFEATQREGFTYADARFDWVDDFAAARTAADNLLLYGRPDAQRFDCTIVDWTCWADCDDEIVGAQNLRTIAANAPAHVPALLADYDYAHDAHGNIVCSLKRERLVRAGHGRWEGRVHEAQIIDGQCAFIDRDLVRWVHRKPPSHGESNERNLRILHAWNEQQPNDPRILGYLGTEHAGRGDTEEAVRWFAAYLQLKTGWDEERCQIHRRMACCLMALDRVDEAYDIALQALKVRPTWPDTYLSLAEATYQRREWDKAEQWARRALELGAPDTLLIINPLDYVLQPRVVLAGALGEQGRVEEAIQVAAEALAIQPGHQGLQQAVRKWRSVAKREATAETFAGCAEMLIAHDEQHKARVLLEEAVPYFVRDHPRIVALRSKVRERLLWADDPALYAEHYETGGSKPEDMIPDEQVTPLCEQLPRVQFLAAGLREQLAEAA